jgi:hypothetical protein
MQNINCKKKEIQNKKCEEKKKTRQRRPRQKESHKPFYMM